MIIESRYFILNIVKISQVLNKNFHGNLSIFVKQAINACNEKSLVIFQPLERQSVGHMISLEKFEIQENRQSL